MNWFLEFVFDDNSRLVTRPITVAPVFATSKRYTRTRMQEEADFWRSQFFRPIKSIHGFCCETGEMLMMVVK